MPKLYRTVLTAVLIGSVSAFGLTSCANVSELKQANLAETGYAYKTDPKCVRTKAKTEFDPKCDEPIVGFKGFTPFDFGIQAGGNSSGFSL